MAIRWPADCYLSADPWAVLLVLYSRSGPLKPGLTGRIVAWGRRPWLALTLPPCSANPEPCQEVAGVS